MQISFLVISVHSLVSEAQSKQEKSPLTSFAPNALEMCAGNGVLSSVRDLRLSTNTAHENLCLTETELATANFFHQLGQAVQVLKLTITPMSRRVTDDESMSQRLTDMLLE